MAKQFSQEVQELINKAKQAGHAVRLLTISGTDYIYRSVNREEFRELQEKLVYDAETAREAAEAKKKAVKDDTEAVAKIDADLEKQALLIRDKGEERLIQKGLISPTINENTPAGVPTTIADRIMELSGFGVEAEPEIL